MFKFLNFKLYIILIISWVSLSGHLTSFFITAGLSSSFFVLILTRYLYSAVKVEIIPSKQSLRKTYLIWLGYQIIIASLNVIKLIWQLQLRVKPEFIEVIHVQQHDRAITVLANSITLTPGTFTCAVDYTHITVHSLLSEFSEGVEDMRTRVMYSFT